MTRRKAFADPRFRGFPGRTVATKTTAEHPRRVNIGSEPRAVALTQSRAEASPDQGEAGLVKGESCGQRGSGSEAALFRLGRPISTTARVTSKPARWPRCTQLQLLQTPA